MDLVKTAPVSPVTPVSDPPRFTHLRKRRSALIVAVLTLTSAGWFTPAAQAAAGHHPAPAVEYLVAADPVAQQVYFYRTSDLHRTGQLDNVGFGSHVGSIALPDGRLLFVDDRHATVNAVKVDQSGKPVIVGRAAIPTKAKWVRAAWAATDRNFRYLAVSSDFENSSTQTVTVVDLRTYAVHQSTLTLTPTAAGTYSEVQVYLAGSPLQLVATTGGRFDSFPLTDVLANRMLTGSSTAPLRQGNHGPVVARDGSAVYSTTPDGFDGASIPGRVLTGVRTVDYSSTRNIVQNYRPRLGADLRTVWGAVSEDTGLSPAQWADTRNDVSRIDLRTFTSQVTRLPDGIPSRLAVSGRYGIVSVISPEGDSATLIDTKAGSTTFGRPVGLIPLPSLSGGPVAGTTATGTQIHYTAITADGEKAFVTNGGDSSITVIDTGRRSVSQTVKTPTALSGGGYLTVLHPDTAQPDLIAR